ncbi:AMP-binding protein [Arthrobacter silvisoli]|uniref:AMP-binding protein n=1 Tax=Arthrobacter silvisoli TaxID=2291022 RepID=UPI000E20E201|nr:AMP-binding protein [Arthrobacter silvisoli]
MGSTTKSTIGTGRLAVSAGKVVDAVAGIREGRAGDRFGVYRAVKSGRLVDECAELLNRGGVVALVPAASSESYVEAIAEQIEFFVRSQAEAEPAERGGILALPTSGSTGAPKLVALPVAGIERFVRWGAAYFGFGPLTVSLSLSPWNFDVSLLDTWAVLAAGGSVVVADTARLHDTAYLAGRLRDHCPTFVQVVPSTLDALVNAADGASYASVRDVVLTGGVASRASRISAARMFPRAKFHNVYGATEINDCLIETMSAVQFAETETLPLGSPIDGCEVFLDSDGGTQSVGHLHAEAEGELLVRTPWMALGYITDGALRPLTAPGDDLYPMKDQASWSDGHLHYLGRRDRTLKLRGQRINLDEIEQAARRTEAVGMACAWVEETGGAQQLHLAYTAPGPEHQVPSGLRLRLAMSARLPAFAMPNLLHPFTAPFPLNGNGKPDLSSIKSRIESE